MADSGARVDGGDGVAEKMNTPDSFNALRYHEHGEPRAVLKLETLNLAPCEKGEVMIQMEAAAVHPSDIGLINGSYGNLRDLPSVAGREGIGTICAVGEGCDQKLLGRPVALPDAAGAWQEFLKYKSEELLLLPALVPFDQLAVSLLNPMTAWRLLNDFEYLKPGDFIIQNAGNSAVGLSVIQFASKMGIHCISLVRTEESRQKILDFSQSEVLIDGDDAVKRVKSLTRGKGCVIGLNSVGGRSALRIAKCLGPGGVHITFGAMDGEAIRFPTRSLIFEDIRFVGFWLDRWKKRRTINDLRKAIEDVLQPLALTEIRHPIDSVFELDQFEKALTRNSESRFGKVLFVRDKENFLKPKGSVVQ